MQSRFLRPEDISRLRSFEFAPQAVAEGYLAGRRHSRHTGTSIEFREHRPYSQGDDIAHLDWRLYARTERHYLKTFELETNTDCHILLDSSASMGFGSGPSKLEYASFFAACLAYLVIRCQDSASLHLFDEDLRLSLPSGRSRPHLEAILGALERNRPGSQTRLPESLRRAFSLLGRKGLLVVVSDFLEAPAAIFEALNLYLHNGYKIYLFQVLDPGELELEATGLTRFIDLETGSRVRAHANEIRSAYRETIERHIRHLRNLAKRRGVSFRTTTTRTPFTELFDELVK